MKAVVTGEDFPGYIGLYLQDRHIFCRDRVRYVGDPVAGVAAISEEIAEEAVDLIEVEYEVLTPVLDPEFGAIPKRRCCIPTWASTRWPTSSSRSRAPTSPTISRSAKATWTTPGASARRSWSANTASRTSSTCRSRPHVAIAKVDEDGRDHPVGQLAIAVRPAQPDRQVTGHLPERRAGDRPLRGRRLWLQGRREHGSRWRWPSPSKCKGRPGQAAS
ncbi:MAG: hypothetical protein M0C28_43975 [Candidatus Moduliflexus flocculans]|nr:hypothetical protein [Candidatus Moduliflexus flocculans]